MSTQSPRHPAPAESAGSARAAPAISGIAAVTSLRLRVNMRTSSPCLCTWMRAPSIFHSNAMSPESVSSASSTSFAVCASIGAMGDITWSWKRCNPEAPASRPTRAMAPRLLSYMAARRTSGSGTPVTAAIASIITPASAPCRSSPTSSRSRNSCSSRVARPNSVRSAVARRALEPLPRIAASSLSSRSTSMTWRLGSLAA